MTTTTPHVGRQRQMRGRRSPRNLLAAYDRSNDQAARIILARPCKSNQLLIDWAHRYTARWAKESREAVSR